MSNNEYLSEEQINLMKLGKQGKLFSISVEWHSTYNNKSGVARFVNKTQTEVMEFRANIFRVGMAVIIDSGTYTVIAPWCLKEITVFRQAMYFDE